MPQQLPGNRIDYAPIAPAAVAAAALAFVFVAFLVVIGLLAALTGKAFQDQRLLYIPALTIVLAFIARRQIRASEGARTGEYWANLGWTVAAVGAALFATYLVAIGYAVRREAVAAFAAFSEPLTRSNPADPLDAELAAATYFTLTPGQQTVVGKPTNTAAIQSGQQDALLRLRVSDLGQLVARNRGEVTITPGTMVRSEQLGSRIEGVMAGAVESPEGVATIAVPLMGDSQEGQPRRWNVGAPPTGGYFAPGSRRLTPYGWAVELLGQSAKRASLALVALHEQGQFEILYEGFVLPGGDPQSVAKRVAERAATALPRAALVGNLAAMPPPPAAEMGPAIDRLFADASGGPRTGATLERSRGLFFTPGRLAAAGSRFKENPDVLPAVALTPEAVEAGIPAEIVLSEGASPPIARAQLRLRASGPGAASLAAELASLKAARGPATAAPPPGAVEQYGAVKWQLVAVRSDLSPVPTAPRPTAVGGPNAPGGPGDMMR